MELFDCAINKKCCSVDEGRGICPFLFVPTPGDLPSKAKEMPMPGGQPGGGGGAQVELI